MSTVIVLAPLIVAGWPAITAAVTAAIGTMGFTLARKAVAAFMLDAIEQKKHFRKIVGLAK